MNIGSSTQILVIGGGPAGSTTATLLAREGFDVTLLEREYFPRYHIGESLLISVQPILDLLGVRDEIENHGFQKKKGVFWEWGDEHWLFNWENLAYNYTFHVKREEFDHILLKNAELKGVKVFQGIQVKRISFNGSRPISANWSEAGGNESGEIKFDYLIDASGRSGIMANRYLNSIKYMKAFQNVAIWGYWNNTIIPQVGVEGPLSICSIPEGWLWGIPLSKKTMSIGLVMHKKLFTEYKKKYSLNRLLCNLCFVSSVLSSTSHP